jgi:hypothetical protein
MPWCGTEMVMISDTVQQSYQYSPLDAQPITAPIGGGSGAWYTSPPSVFKGKSTTPWTPFNGPVSTGNPYLVVTVNNKNINWSTYDFSDTNCNNNSNKTCSGSIQIDPIPYAVPGAYYDASGNPVGLQSNPFAIIVTSLYADASHAGQWGTRVVNGVQQWGTFSTPLNVLGTTVYQYVKKM